LDAEDGAAAVRAARTVAEAETRGRKADISLPPSFDAPSGVFVTIETHPRRDLRGCIGYPEPVMPLKDALRESARSACHDPRFPPLSYGELNEVVFEVTVLSIPQTIRHTGPEDLLGKMEVGRDGLILECRGRRGLLLPQVPVEWGWGKEEYLVHLSLKAGLPPDAWTWPDAVVHAFTGEIFSETEPKGEIVRK